MKNPDYENWSQVQRKLFDSIRSHAEAKFRYPITELIRQWFGIRKTASYQKIRGETPLKFPEIRILANHLGPTLVEELLPDDANLGWIEIINAKPGMSSISILEEFLSLLRGMLSDGPVHMICSSPSVPSILAFHSPGLFHQIQSLRTSLSAKGYETFGRDSKYFDPALPNILGNLEKVVSSIHSQFLLSGNPFTYIQKQAAYLNSMSTESEPYEKKFLHHQFGQICDLLESKCELDIRSASQISIPSATFHFNELYALPDVIHLSNAHTKKVIWNPFSLNQWQSQSAMICENTADILHTMLDHSVCITANNRAMRLSFFKKLRSSFEKWPEQWPDSKKGEQGLVL